MVADTRNDRFDTRRAELGASCQSRKTDKPAAGSAAFAAPAPSLPSETKQTLSFFFFFALKLKKFLSLTLNKQVNALLFLPK